MVDKAEGKFAQVVNQQENSNVERNYWMDMTGCVSWDGYVEPTGESWASFTKTPVNVGTVSKKKKTTYKYLHPYTVTAHQFRLNIPKNAYIHTLFFDVMMKGTNKVPAPYAMFCVYGNAWNTRKSNNAPNNTGWYDGLYRVHLNKNLSDNYIEYNYGMGEAEIQQGGFTPDVLNHDKMGVDLVFKDSKNQGACALKWVRCRAYYILPEHWLSFDIVSSRDSPYEVATGKRFKLLVTYTNPTKASGGYQELDVELPMGTQLMSCATTGDCSFNMNTMKWRVNGNAGQTSTLSLDLKNKVVGLRELSVGRPHIDGEEDVNNISFYYYGRHGITEGSGEFTCSSDEMRKGVRGCFHIKGKAIDANGQIPCSVTSDCDYDLDHVSVILNENESSEGVSITTSSLAETGTFIINVPENKEVNVSFDYCIIPLDSGTDFEGIFTNDTDQTTFNFDVKPPYSYKFTSTPTTDDTIIAFNPRPINLTWSYPRIATAISLGITAFECGVDPLDANMIMSDCDLQMEKWETIPYIASVPVKHSHYDPKSDYENPLVKKQYKTKKYTGKEGVIDEKITLNLKVPPQDVTTLQGYVEMDKPVPINLVPTAFEGDALNHRGWVELTKVGNVEKTNPLYYKIECDVEYITHNINSKFEIKSGLYTNNDPTPTILQEVLRAGDQIMVDENDYFTVDTDGTYLYDGDSVVDLRNMFSLGEGQHVYIKSRETLAPHVEVDFSWFNTLLAEYKSNNIERIIRLVNKATGNVVFEYVYHNFTFKEDWVSCQVTGTRLNENGGSVTEINQTMDLQLDLESEDITPEQEEPEDQLNTDMVDETISELLYGSTLQLVLTDNNLKLIDKGYNGREVYKDNIELDKGEYYLEIDFINHNQNANDADILFYSDLQVKETALQTDYAGLYNKLLVSPFPLMNKKLVFTRKAEEGTIYYFYDNDEPAKFRIDPYLQYHNGVDLRANKGIQIFNLNNSYEYFYVQNGLVSVGFNRYDGYIFLGKWDTHSQEYVTTHTFSVGEDVKFDLKPISDDRIDIMVNEAVFTVWRGHPYVMVSHQNLDIQILTPFKSIFGEKVAGHKADLLSNFLLLNTDNLLPACAGSMDSLKGKCLTVEVPEDDLVVETSISVHDNSSASLHVGDEVDLTATVSYTSTHTLTGKVHYFIEGVDVGSADVGETFTHVFDKDQEYVVYAVYTGTDYFKCSISEQVNLKILQPTPKWSAVTVPELTGVFTLQCIKANNPISFLDGSEVQFQLLRGGSPVSGKIIEVDAINGSTFTETTDANGIVRTYNNREASIGKHKWAARFYDKQDGNNTPKILMVKAEKTVQLNKANTRLTVTTPTDGKRKQGEKTHIRLQRYINGEWTAFANQKIIITVNGGNKITKTTNDKGMVYLKMSHKGSRKLKIMYAGNAYHKNVTLKKTITVR